MTKVVLRSNEEESNLLAIKRILKTKGLFGLIKTGKGFLKEMLINFPKLKYYDLTSPVSPLVFKTVFGNTMILDIRDRGACRQILLNGIREKQATEQLMKEIKNGMKILEIGANVGYYLLIESKLNPDGKILAFEPDPRSFRILNMSVLLNNCRNVELKNIALGSKNGEIPFYLSEQWNLSGINAVSNSNKVMVKIARLDDVVNEKFDYLRMDVEGYEFEILKGAEKSLRNLKGMFIELHPVYLGKGGCIELIDWLKERGFIIKVAYDDENKGFVYYNSKEMLKNKIFEKYGWHIFFNRKTGSRMK